MSRVPKIQPYRRGDIYRSVTIRATDRFTLIDHSFTPSEEHYLSLAERTGVYDDAYDRCKEFNATATNNGWQYRPPPWDPPGFMELMRAYLYEKATSSFGIMVNGFQTLRIAFRSEKDHFKYSLTFNDTSRIKVWSSSDPFWVFIDENDPLPFAPIKSNDWNQSDPKTGWL